MRGERLQLAAHLVTGQEALIQEPAEPFQLAAVAIHVSQVIHLPYYLIRRPGITFWGAVFRWWVVLIAVLLVVVNILGRLSVA